ncbi:TPA: nucleoside triphosphate pyrophosphohydrolase family protein [Vibrio metschnikovii]|uniref:Nucleoside triphosphate pyrophosphohydrolase family protein n=1 Tax=bacterium 19PA01SH03 TaxID=2920705 RepID=A0AAU6SJX4_UNCXX|nr:nucleoside triphosphate pyrophosphohydrolase family protein [Vibrio sp. V33_P6A3T137]EKO3607541.1 nucleoside triphosphate pyrophosphohydrolase family protein [Vibrio metschnikovii]EKO3609430.1 nucleoside triphosphate pyrophosphohydrolase family protein [Vibrio metschnikovii]EKO3638839.1 nucleoside triphosphate pyrophosphohydrolase family protein [Vibrio metschnikovii]EKO3682232.1 nucleoside triphosphate pyrophosphohydrolase family protein [Vibrio metschnikovii]EKO3699258.1 nucleoside tripho
MHLSKLTEDIYQHLYRDISEFRHTFDLPVADPSSLDSQADTLHTSLIIEELTELAEADCTTEQADAIVDSVYVLMGRLVHLGHTQITDNLTISYLIDLLLNVAVNRGIDFLPCWDEVHASNMSKVCRNEQEFIDTEAFYAKQNIPLTAVQKGDYIIAKCAKDVVMEGKTIRQGKVLKSVYYRPANLAALTQS